MANSLWGNLFPGTVAGGLNSNQNIQNNLGAQQQQWQQQWQQAQGLSGLAQQFEPPIQPDVMLSVVQSKAHQQALRAIELMPMSLAVRLTDIQFYRSRDGAPARFVVRFTDGRNLEFGNVDTFPADADIARIALESP